MKIQKSPIRFPLLAAIIFTSLTAPLAAEELAFSDVKTKFSANMAMWFGGKKAPMLEQIEEAEAALWPAFIKELVVVEMCD